MNNYFPATITGPTFFKMYGMYASIETRSLIDEKWTFPIKVEPSQSTGLWAGSQERPRLGFDNHMPYFKTSVARWTKRKSASWVPKKRIQRNIGEKCLQEAFPPQKNEETIKGFKHGRDLLLFQFGLHFWNLRNFLPQFAVKIVQFEPIMTH